MADPLVKAAMVKPSRSAVVYSVLAAARPAAAGMFLAMMAGLPGMCRAMWRAKVRA
jgi:hypothetical protein